MARVHCRRFELPPTDSPPLSLSRAEQTDVVIAGTTVALQCRAKEREKGQQLCCPLSRTANAAAFLLCFAAQRLPLARPRCKARLCSTGTPPACIGTTSGKRSNSWPEEEGGCAHPPPSKQRTASPLHPHPRRRARRSRKAHGGWDAPARKRMALS